MNVYLKYHGVVNDFTDANVAALIFRSRADKVAALEKKLQRARNPMTRALYRQQLHDLKQVS